MLRTRLCFRLITLLLLLWSNGCAIAGAETLKIGVLSVEPKSESSAQWQPLADYLNSKLAPNYSAKVMLYNYHELNQAVRTRQIDFLLTNPGHYTSLHFHAQVSTALLSLVKKQNGVALSEFGGVIVVRNHSSIHRLTDLKSKRIAAVSKHSLGGYQMQAFELMQQGIPPSSLFMQWTDMPHDKVIEQLLSKQVDAGFVRSGVIERLVNEGKLNPDEIKVLNDQALPDFPMRLSTRLYPEWPLVALPHVKQKSISQVVATLLLLPHDSPIANLMGIHGFNVAANYTIVRDILQAMGFPPYEQLPSYFLPRLWYEHRPLIVLSIVATMMILLLLLWVLLLNRHLSRQQTKAVELSTRLSEIIDATQVGTWEWRIQGSEIRFNKWWTIILGYRLDELQPVSIDTWRRLVHPDDLSACDAARQACFNRTSSYYNVDYRMQHKANYWVWVNDQGKVVEWSSSGEPLLMRGTHTDISDRKHLEDDLRHALGSLVSILDNIPGAAYKCLCDREWTMKFFSLHIEQISGYPAEDFINNDKRSYASIIHPSDRLYVEKSVMQGVKKNQPYTLEYRIIHADGKNRWVIEGGRAVHDRHGKVDHLDGVIFDITDKKMAALKNERLATHDGLTGLYNRSYFNENYGNEWQRAIRDQLPIAILMIDIDDFKKYNDTYGHVAGDACIQVVVQKISDALRRQTDMAFRYGGEEFILMLHNTQSKDAATVANKILGNMRGAMIPHKASRASAFVSVSIGVASMIPKQYDTPDQLIIMADKGLYQAKEQGRNQMAIWTDG